MLQNSIKHQIPGELITKLHFNDLLLMIIILDINDLKQAIANKQREFNQSRGYDSKEISSQEAVSFLKGGK